MSCEVTSRKNLVCFLVGGVFLLGVAGSTLAQRAPAGPPPGAGPPPNNNPNLEDRSRRVDESRLRSAEKDVGGEDTNLRRLRTRPS